MSAPPSDPPMAAEPPIEQPDAAHSAETPADAVTASAEPAAPEIATVPETAEAATDALSQRAPEVLATPPAPARLDRLLGALLLAADKPLSIDAVVGLVNGAADEEEWPTTVTPPEVHAAILRLAARWRTDEGFELVESGAGWRVRTASDLAVMVRRLWPERAVRLGKAALEALAVVAYRQPCTRLEVEEIRGVDCGGVLRSLLDRRLVQIIGRKDEVGRPLLYGTTAEFLEVFALTDLRALPTLRDLESMQIEAAVRARGAEVHGAAHEPAGDAADGHNALQDPELYEETSADPELDGDVDPPGDEDEPEVPRPPDSATSGAVDAVQASAQSPAASSPATPMDPTRADT